MEENGRRDWKSGRHLERNRIHWMPYVPEGVKEMKVIKRYISSFYAIIVSKLSLPLKCGGR
jgi:hypothetical protein